MKIAVMISKAWNVPSVGGGAFYSLSITEAISKLDQSDCPHEIVFIADKKDEINQIYGKEVLTFTTNETEISPVKYQFLDKVLNIIGKYSYGIKLLQHIYTQEELAKTRKIQSQLFEEFVKTNKIDLVYYPFPLIALSVNVPFFTTIWDLGHLTINIFPEVTADGEYERREATYRYISSKAVYVLSDSDAGKQEILKYYSVLSENKVKPLYIFPSNIIHHTLETQYQIEILKSYQLHEEKFLFYPAQFWAHKNHYSIIKAMQFLIKEKNTNVKIVFTGSDKGNENYIKTLVKDFNMTDNVFFLGFVSQDELYTLYKSALALIMPTFLGPTNMPLIEALHLKCPIICSDFDGHREICQDAALYVIPDDYLDIAHKIDMLWNNENLRNQLIYTGSQLALKTKFNLDKSVSLLVSYFNDFDKIRRCWS